MRTCAHSCAHTYARTHAATGKLAALLYNAPTRAHEVALAAMRRCPDNDLIVVRAVVLLLDMTLHRKPTVPGAASPDHQRTA